MFNISDFKKAGKSLGRKISNVDDFCKDVELYREAEKLADNRKLQNLNRRTNHLGETYIFGKFGTGADSVMVTIGYLGKNKQDAPGTQIEKAYRSGVPITLSEVERGDYKFSEISEEVSSSVKAKKKADYQEQTHKKIKERLEYLRGEIEAERISYGEITELQSLSQYIAPSDTLLREWAGMPENTEASKKKADYQGWKNRPTWAVALWLDNDGFEAPEEMTESFELAEYIKEMVEEGNPLSGETTMYADLLTGVLWDVDYREIAENILSSRG